MDTILKPFFIQVVKIISDLNMKNRSVEILKKAPMKLFNKLSSKQRAAILLVAVALLLLGVYGPYSHTFTLAGVEFPPNTVSNGFVRLGISLNSTSLNFKISLNLSMSNVTNQKFDLRPKDTILVNQVPVSDPTCLPALTEAERETFNQTCRYIISDCMQKGSETYSFACILLPLHCSQAFLKPYLGREAINVLFDTCFASMDMISGDICLAIFDMLGTMINSTEVNSTATFPQSPPAIEGIVFHKQLVLEYAMSKSLLFTKFAFLFLMMCH